MTRRIRTLSLAAALLVTTTGAAFAASPGGTNPVPPNSNGSVLSVLISLLGL